MEINYTEFTFVLILFAIYLLLWKLKQFLQIKKSGIDPEVISKSKSNTQKFMNSIFNILTTYFIIIFILHIINFQFYSLFIRFEFLNNPMIKSIGFVVGIFGLSLCLYAQMKMGNSWRVGIDDRVKTKLITTGLYQFIRNPTYLGLFILNLGVWLLLPTWTIFIFNILFVYTLEFQVRCEEDYLEKNFDEEYLQYKKQTKRYIPYIY